MAKAVFRPGELITVPEKLIISSPVLETFSAAVPEADDPELEPVIEEYTGPTAEDLRREAEEFKVQWNSEKEAMIQAAKNEAESIVKVAEQTAEDAKRQSSEDADALRTVAREEADKILADVKQRAENLMAETRKTLEDERKAAFEEGKEAGRLEGYAEGKVEVDRLIQRTQVVLERAQDKRGEILIETEKEIVDLVLLIARKVVKVIADNQREVIISNVVKALRKVRDRGNIIIHVNLVDLKLTTEHTKDFIKMMEGVKSMQVMEDSSVDPGGCIIETDFGEIDARIASQLAELESKILEISPVRTRAKPAVSRESK
jgi:flagellar assembly protein FliH